MSDGHISVVDSVQLTEEAREKYDACPECGEEYVGLDTTLSGKLVFIHQETPIVSCTVEMNDDEGER